MDFVVAPMGHSATATPDPTMSWIFSIATIIFGIVVIIKPDLFFKSWQNQQKFFGLNVTANSRYFMWQRVGGVGLIFMGLFIMNPPLSQAFFGFLHKIGF